MTNLFSMVLMMMLIPQPQNLPGAANQVPTQIREKATVIVTGTYVEGRGPCMFLSDGTRRWAREYWFNVKKVYRGSVGGKTIYINTKGSPKINDVSVNLKHGRDYLVFLRPNEESMRVIKAGDYVPVWDALEGEEIIAIVEIS